MIKQFFKTIKLIQGEYKKSNIPWFIGFSGGKDSSALLKLVYIAVKRLKKRRREIIVVYCDTGVEMPVIRKFVFRILKKIKSAAATDKIPIRIKIIKPKLEDRFFVKVIGKGYPPPTNKFRWCTDKLRVNPINKTFKLLSNSARNMILLGTRKGESRERDRILNKYKTEAKYFFKQANNKNTKIFCPLFNYSTTDIWDILLNIPFLKNINFNELAQLYSFQGVGRLEDSNNRFGCWTCTVIRRDRALESLIQSGLLELQPLLSFRNWLMEIRDVSAYRLKRRRNGQPGPGPFTLVARKMILRKLLHTQKQVPFRLISCQEKSFIKHIWKSENKLLI